VRVALVALFGVRVPGHVLVDVPEVGLPGWAAGVGLGGPVTAEALLGGLYEGLRIVGLLAAVGAANALAEPHRLLRALPPALSEAAVALTVAISLAPQAGAAGAAVRDARRLRGRPTRGIAAVRGVALPVLEGALDRSVALAASMDSRGFGRLAGVDGRARRVRAALAAFGMLGLAVGAYGLLDGGARRVAGLALFGLGAVLVTVALTVRAGGPHRTRYRPDRFGWPEWSVVSSGLAVFAGLMVAGRSAGALAAPVAPPWLPPLPLLPVLVVLLAAAPLFTTPEPPR